MTDFYAHLQHARDHHERGDQENALLHCKKALEENPYDATALTLYGAVEAARGFHKRASDAFKKALSANPSDKRLLLNVASSLKELGKFDEARANLEKAIALDPKYAPAYYTLSSIRKFTHDDPWIEKFETLKRQTTGHPLYQRVTCFALGKIYDDVGEYDRAFTNYKQGNDIRAAQYDHGAAKSFFDAVKTRYGHESQALSGSGDQTTAPIFIVGMPRSGSSLIEETIATNCNAAGLGERPEIGRLFSHSCGPQPGTAADYGGAYVKRMGMVAPDAEWFIDKNLLNHSLVGFIQVILPNAHIIHVKRDPIDTCLSCYFQNFMDGHEYSFALESLAKRYALYVEIMKYWSQTSAQILDLHYENFIANKNEEQKRLFGHIGMQKPDDALKNFPSDRAIPTASAWQARQPIYQTSVKRWKNYEKHLAPLLQAFERDGFSYDGDG